jgi:oligopeptidase B
MAQHFPWIMLDGKELNKKNTFNDFIDVTEYLIKNKYTNSTRLGIRSVSAGGLLIGDVINERPDLFKAAVARSPFVDALNTELDVKIPYTPQEWTQWGNPYRFADYFYIKRYSPYENIGKHDYPALLVEGSLLDNQVLIHEPAKFVARLRANKTDKNDLIFRVNMTGAHGGDSGATSELNDHSYDIAWLMNQLEIH